MNMDLAGNIYFTLGSYLLAYMLVGVACLVAVAFVTGRIVPRIRSLVSSAQTKESGFVEPRDLRLAHGSM
jgi:hypothetical protein